MKKYLILLILPFFLCSCYDYNELNDLAIISGVGIDYKNDNYTVTFEILSTKKEGDSSGATKTYSVSAKGKTIPEAFRNNGNNMDKVSYFDHVEVVVISEEVAKHHLEEVSEYIIRSAKFRNEVYLTIAKNNTAKEIITTTSKEKPVASNFIVDLLEHSNNTSSAAYYTPFTKTLSAILTPGEDAITSVLSLDDKEIILNGMAIFKDFKLVTILDNHEASIMNLLNNFNANTIMFTKKCASKSATVLSIYEANIKIIPHDTYTEITGTLNGRINEDSCHYDFRQINTYKTLEQEFADIIASDMTNVLNTLKSSESNALNIGKIYYNQTRKPYYNLWFNNPLKYNLNLKINKKGLIFEVN